jgi:amino acid transporter
LLVIGLGLSVMGDAPQAAAPAAGEGVTWLGILQGSALAFFAFIGFEDMVNVSEEVRHPKRNMPLAIFTALGVAASLYMVVAWIATSVIPPERLAASEAPLWEVVRTAAPWLPAWLFPAIAMVAVANTGLLNFIMGSRLLYGMSRDRLAPRWLDAVHARTRTPHRAIVIVLIAAIVLALSGTISMLAGTTNVLLLLVFSTVNVALIVIKRTKPGVGGGFRVPLAVPIAATVFSLALIAFAEWKSLLLALSIVALGTVLVALHRRVG